MTQQYEPRNSSEHDHLCDCPGCNQDGPEPTEEEAQRIEAEMGPEPADDFIKSERTCGICGQTYQWSADDIESQYEICPFMPCGDKWEFLDEVIDWSAWSKTNE